MGKVTFNNDRLVREITKVNAGTGSFNVDITFTPLLVAAMFRGHRTKAGEDGILWELNRTATGYRLIVDYAVKEPREIEVVLAGDMIIDLAG